MDFLEKLTKSELIDLISELVENEVLRIEDVKGVLNIETQNELENSIVEKIKNKVELSLQEIEYIKDYTFKIGNRKVKGLLCSSNVFTRTIVEYKLNIMFSHIWKKYPKKVNLVLAKKSFFKLFSDFKYSLIDKVYKQINTKLLAYIDNSQGTEQQFILHFSTWLNQKRWNDEI